MARMKADLRGEKKAQMLSGSPLRHPWEHWDMEIYFDGHILGFNGNLMVNDYTVVYIYIYIG